MDAALGVILFILGSGLVGLCLFAIPGPVGEGSPPPSHGHH
ncbi:MAG TPA: hypothetical protein VGU20_04470 [Stellaceae bacterium]|nr:hypothetical protein [Stellaceae bacterium]